MGNSGVFGDFLGAMMTRMIDLGLTDRASIDKRFKRAIVRDIYGDPNVLAFVNEIMYRSPNPKEGFVRMLKGEMISALKGDSTPGILPRTRGVVRSLAMGEALHKSWGLGIWGLLGTLFSSGISAGAEVYKTKLQLDAQEDIAEMQHSLEERKIAAKEKEIEAARQAAEAAMQQAIAVQKTAEMEKAKVEAGITETTHATGGGVTPSGVAPSPIMSEETKKAIKTYGPIALLGAVVLYLVYAVPKEKEKEKAK